MLFWTLDKYLQLNFFWLNILVYLIVIFEVSDPPRCLLYW